MKPTDLLVTKQPNTMEMFGKITMHPHIIDALEYARETGATVGLISNAGKFTPLTEEQADQMVEKYYAQNGAQQ